MKNPFKSLFRSGPDLETRSMPVVTSVYIDAKRRAASSEGQATLSATLATCAGIWSRSFAMLVPDPVDAISPADLAAIGLDLFFRGQSVWRIRLDGSAIRLDRAAFWDIQSRGRWNLTIPQPDGTETARCLDGEVLSLRINSAPDAPWFGRSPLYLMGLTPSLLADVEGTFSGALPWVGKGILPVPANIPEEQKTSALQGLRGGSMLSTVTSKEEIGHHTGGARSEFKRVDLSPDLTGASLPEQARDLHARVLAAAGIPPSLYDAGGNAGALRETYRLFVNQTLEPLARIITPELAKIGVSRLGTEDTMSSDTAGRARSVASLVASGVPVNLALSMCGWDNIQLPGGASKPLPAGGE